MSDIDLDSQLSSFVASLGEFEARASVNWQVAEVFNVLLEQAKKTHGDNPVVAAIRPVGKSQTGRSAASAGELRALANQLLAAT